MRSYNRVFRVMHWAIALCLFFLLLTIFLRMYWMEKNHVADIMEAELLHRGYALERADLIVIAKKIRKPMWQWHIYAGYALVGLYAIRMALPMAGHMKFLNPLKALTPVLKLRAWSYVAFYAFVAISLITGVLIEWGPAAWEPQAEDIHKLSLYYLLPFIALHFAGLFLAEKSAEKGVVSRMIRGERRLSADEETEPVVVQATRHR